MKMHSLSFVILALMFGVMAVTALGEVPHTMGYQGRVTNAVGQPVDSITDITFILYADSLGVEQIWSETHPAVAINDGIFTALLGSINLSFPSYFHGKQRWLGLQIGGGPVGSPLIPIVSSTYAFKSQTSDTSALALKAQEAAFATEAGSVVDNSINSASIANGTILCSDIAQNGATSGQVIKWNGGAWAPASDAVGSNTSGWEDAGTVVRLDYSTDSVGIGTTAPVEKLHVNGAARVTSRVEFGEDSIMIYGTGGDMVVSARDDLFLRSAEYLFFGKPDGTSWMRVDNLNERLGIGTTGLVDEMLQVENNNSGGRAFLQIETSHASGFSEAGIRIKTPQNTWHLRMDDASNNNLPDGALGLRSQAGYEATTWLENGNVGIGTTNPGSHRLHIKGSSSGTGGAALLAETENASGVAAYCYANSNYPALVSAQKGTGDFFRCYSVDASDNYTTVTRVTTTGRVICPVLELTGGSDVAEPFEMAEGASLPLGALVVIDEDNPGKLRLAESPYDARVAGVVSGAGGINPGITLSQQSVNDQGQNVAITGRVYCLADAGYGAIKPGDLLTTSATKGHAMVASDRSRSYGAVIGKAMSSLDSGTGLVLILVSLQ